VKTYIALFRGINVGGKHSLPMKELVAILESLGAQNVKTYIQSGNAVFQSQEADMLRLSDQISGAILQRRGFEPRVLLLALADLEQAVVQNPFPEGAADPKTLHLGFLYSAPEKPDLEAMESLKSPSERFQLIGKYFYLFAPEGIGRSKLVEKTEKLLGVPLTDRNWRTVCTLLELAREVYASSGA
jgi:uncharacterized protein (DUF1697 family)